MFILPASSFDPELKYCRIEGCSCVSFEAGASDSLEKTERELEADGMMRQPSTSTIVGSEHPCEGSPSHGSIGLIRSFGLVSHFLDIFFEALP
jgi:hypothetical protein